MPSWKKIVVSGSDATLNSLFVSTAVTASVFSGSFTGSLFGRSTTASYYELVTGSSGTDFNIVPTPSGSIINIPDASATARGLVTTGSQTFFGTKTFSGSINTIDSNFYVARQQGATSTATFALLGSVIGSTRVFFDGLVVTIPNTQAHSSLLIGSNDVQEGTSGVHPLIANVAIQPLDVTNGTATTTNAATLYIEGAARGTATITNNYAIWVDSGSVRLDGDLIMSQSNVIVTGSVISTGGFTGSLFGTSSWAVSSSLASTASYAVTSSFVVNGAYLSTGNVTVGNLARFYTATTIGNSNLFDDANGTIQITGSTIIISGSSSQLRVTGSISATGGLTGSLFGTASYVTGSIFGSTNLVTSASHAVSWSGLFSPAPVSTYILLWNGSAVSSSALRDTGTQIRSDRQISIDTGGLQVLSGGITSSNAVRILAGGIEVTGSFSVTGSTIINTQQNTDVDIGTEVVATVPTASMYGAFFDYTVTDLTNYRAGTVMAVWNTVGSVQYTDNSTPDIGDTSGVTLAVVANGSNVELRATVTTNNWNIKTFVRSI